MFLAALCTLLLILLFIALHLAEGRRSRQKRERQQHGLSVLGAGLELMAAIQQHRGLSIAFLSGDLGFRGKMLAKREEIQGLLVKMQALVVHTAELQPDLCSLKDVSNDWEKLLRGGEDQQPETSFKQHTALVRRVIHLLADMGEHLGLLDNEGTPLARLSNTLLLRLPLLLESIGQARALGSGYAASGKCGAVGRIRLSFLEQRIRECLEGVQSAPSAEHAVVARKVDALLTTLRQRFISAEQVDIVPALFFQTATDAIESCLALWKEIAIHTSQAVRES